MKNRLSDLLKIINKAGGSFNISQLNPDSTTVVVIAEFNDEQIRNVVISINQIGLSAIITEPEILVIAASYTEEEIEHARSEYDWKAII